MNGRNGIAMPRALMSIGLVAAFSVFAAAAEIPDGATGHYVLDGDVTDASGNDAHGILDEDVATHPIFVPDETRGKMVAVFDGFDDLIDVTASGATLSSKLNGPGPEDDVLQFTVGFWVKFTNVDANGNDVVDYNVVMGSSRPALNGGLTTVELVGDGSWFNFGSDGGIGIVSGPASGNSWRQTGEVNGLPPIDLFDEQWHHMVMSWEDPDGDPAANNEAQGGDRTPISVWIDNVLADKNSNNGKYGGLDRGNLKWFLGMGLGSNAGAGDYPAYFSGALSDVIFYERVLEESEVADLFEVTGGAVVNPVVPGDTNDDGSVDRVDAATVLRNLGSTISFGPATGDFDGDFSTTLADLAVLQQHYGTVPTGSPGAASVPEPGGFVLMVVGAFGGVAARYRRRAKSSVTRA